MPVRSASMFRSIIRVAAATAAVLALASPASAGARCGGEYTVRPGDTLAKIAAHCDSSVGALMRANPRIVDPARISIGWRLAVPAGDVEDDAEGMASATAIVPAGAEVTGPLTVSGRIVNGLRCAMIETAEGEEFGVVSPDLAFRSGSEVTLLGRLVDDPSCKGPRTLLVTEQSFASL